MQSFPSDIVTSDNQLGSWNNYSYGYSEFTMPGSDWITSLPGELGSSPLTFDVELQQKDPYSASLPTGMHRIAPLDASIKVVEADSTQHQHQSYPFAFPQYNGGTADFNNHNQKHAQSAMKTVSGHGYVPQGYHNSGPRASPSTAGPMLNQSTLYPSPPVQPTKHDDVATYNKCMLYMNGDHVPQPTTYSESPVPFGAHPPSDLYQPYAVAPSSNYEENFPSFQSVLPTAIESVLPTPKYDMWGSSSEPMSSPETILAMANGQCSAVNQEQQASYHSPPTSSLAGGSSVKMEQLSDISQSPPPSVAVAVPPGILSAIEIPSPLALPPLESAFLLEPQIQQHGIPTLDGAPIANAMTPTALKKPARITNHYGAQFSCPECERTFARQCGLTQHMKWHHSGDKPFRCTTCGKCFSGEHALAHHTQRHTAIDKPHRCHVCPKAFFHKNDLRRHAYQHTGTAPHTCKYCNKSFARKDHCHSHEFSHERRVERQEKKLKSRDRVEL